MKMPNFASRNHSGAWYARRLCQSFRKGPSATALSKSVDPRNVHIKLERSTYNVILTNSVQTSPKARSQRAFDSAAQDAAAEDGRGAAREYLAHLVSRRPSHSVQHMVPAGMPRREQ